MQPLNLEPLIYTSLGNVAVSSLEYKQGWIDDGSHLWHHEHWYLNGELVRNDVHGYKLQDVTLWRLLKKWFGRKKTISLSGVAAEVKGAL